MCPNRYCTVKYCTPAKILGEMSVCILWQSDICISPQILAGFQCSTLPHLWGHTYFNSDTVLRWEYIAGYLPLIWKSGLFPTFNAANIVLIPYLDNMFGLQSHTKSLESNRTLFTLMGSHIHNSEYSLIMSFNDIKIICKTFWMFKTLYLMVPWSFATLEPEKIDQILIFQFVQWLCLCDVKYLPLKVFGQRACLIF